MARNKSTTQRKPITVQRKPTRRARNAEPIGEFGMQDLKNIGQKIGNAVQGVKERVSPSTIPVARPQSTQYQSPRAPTRRQSPVTDLTPKNTNAQSANVKRTSQIPTQTNVRKTTEIPAPVAQPTPKPGIGSRIAGKINQFKDQLQKKPAVTTPQKTTSPTQPAITKPKTDMTADERKAARQLEREARRAAWRSSLKNANNSRGFIKPADTQRSDIIDRLKEKAKELKEGASEVKEDLFGHETPSAEPSNSNSNNSEEQIKLYGSGDHYRTDQNGILYRKNATSGKWVSTGKPSKYGKPKEVSEDIVEDDIGDIGLTSEPSNNRRTRQPRSGSSEEPEAAISAPKGAISSGVLGSTVSGASTYDERAEKEKMRAFDKSGSALNVGSEYISAGSYKGSGYNAQREQERMAKIDRAGSPMSAGLGYITTRKGHTNNSQSPDNAHLAELNDSDSFSSGAFPFRYGSKQKKPVDLDAQIANELAKASQIQNRNAQLAQLAELQKMQQAQPPSVIAQTELQPEKDTMKFLFGVTTNPTNTQKPTPKAQGSATTQFFGLGGMTEQPKKKQPDTRSATNKLFGSGINAPPQEEELSNGSATIDFFNLNAVKNKTGVKTEVGAFGRKKPHASKTKPKTYPKQVIDIKTYTPKNFVPESKGGILGIYEKNQKMQKVNIQKPIKPMASEMLFGGRK